MTSSALKTLIEEKSFVTCPGVFDLVSAKLADLTRADALYMTGYGVVASYLGLPDAGLATYSQMLDRVAGVVQMRLFRARQKLREIMLQQYPEEWL